MRAAARQRHQTWPSFGVGHAQCCIEALYHKIEKTHLELSRQLRTSRYFDVEFIER
jgi:hypothetical protein